MGSRLSNGGPLGISQDDKIARSLIIYLSLPGMFLRAWGARGGTLFFFNIAHLVSYEYRRKVALLPEVDIFCFGRAVTRLKNRG